MAGETIKVRVKLGGNWLSRLTQVNPKEITFSMEESKAHQFTCLPENDFWHIHDMMRMFSIDNYKIVEVNE